MYYLNFSVYLITCAVCLCIATIIGRWCFYVDRKENPFSFWFFVGVANIKFGLFLLAGMNCLQMVEVGVQPTLWTLPARLYVLFGVCLHFWIMTRVRPTQLSSVKFERLY